MCTERVRGAGKREMVAVVCRDEVYRKSTNIYIIKCIYYEKKYYDNYSNIGLLLYMLIFLSISLIKLYKV